MGRPTKATLSPKKVTIVEVPQMGGVESLGVLTPQPPEGSNVSMAEELAQSSQAAEAPVVNEASASAMSGTSAVEKEISGKLKIHLNMN